MTKVVWKYSGIDTNGRKVRKTFLDGFDCAEFARKAFERGIHGCYAPWTVAA